MIEVVGNDEQRAAMFSALPKAMERIGPVTKDNEAIARGGRKYKYADLTAVLEAIRPILPAPDLGLWYTQNPGRIREMEKSGVSVQTIDAMITHEGGAYIKYETDIPMGQEQAMGVSTSYGRRYQSGGNWTIGMEDNDGQHSGPPNPPTRNTPMVQAARDMGLTLANDASSPSAPSSALTRPIGSFTVRDLQPAYKAVGFPTLGIVGAFLSGEPKNIAPTDELLEPWQEQNPTGTMKDLLVESANWFIENGKGDKTKSDLADWLGSQE